MVIGIIEDWPQAQKQRRKKALRRLDENIGCPDAPVLSVEQAMNHPATAKHDRGRV